MNQLYHRDFQRLILKLRGEGLSNERSQDHIAAALLSSAWQIA
jgi:hypothetical protein